MPQQADLTSLGEMYSAAGSGDWALAAKLAHARHDADKAAGQSNAEDDAFVDAIDKAQQGDRDTAQGGSRDHRNAPRGGCWAGAFPRDVYGN
jgi:hypothetical protein